MESFSKILEVYFLKIYAIADLHLSFGVNKPMDIFGGWHNHAARIEENWQRKITADDLVVLPGDLSWGMNFQEAKKDFEFLNDLNGRKIISKGNHDYWWTTKNKMDNFLAENSFDTIKILHNNHFKWEDIGVCGSRGWINDSSEPADAKVLAREAGRLTLSIESALKEGLRPVVFLHYPPVFAGSRNEPILDVLYKYGIKTVFYGHLHGKAKNYAINGMYDGIDYHLIASDFLQFDPLDITKIVQSDNS